MYYVGIDDTYETNIKTLPRLLNLFQLIFLYGKETN